ncbi:MAG TPA: GNAT family N-acetyltransferase [Actinomycetota bacterium]|nr:GNAT family N-acetyltransferase [Actinomycetota bacterium]
MRGPIAFGRPDGTAETEQLGAILDIVYLRSPEEGRRWLDRTDPDHLRVLRTGGTVVGGMRVWPLGQWYGGRPVPMWGVASVAVDPAHRASGFATGMMRSSLEEMHSAGAALSALYPATQPVYRRTGWELAGTWTRFRLPAAAIDVRDRELDIRRVDAGDGVFKQLYDRRAAASNGHLARTEAYWRFVQSPRSEETVHRYVVERDGRPEGYVVFTQDREGAWRYNLNCRDVVATSPAAARRLWTFFADHRSFSEDVTWSGSGSDPMLFVLREQEWKAPRSWTWMLRIVDVKAALSERGYPAGMEAEVHLDVRDDVCGWNEGRWVLSVAGGRGQVRKGGRGRLRIDVRGLASLYSGFSTGSELVATGYAEGREGDLAAATAAFSGPAPVLPDFF